MIDPRQKALQDEEDVAERKPDLESERLKDLTTPEDDAERVKGGDTGGAGDPRYRCDATM